MHGCSLRSLADAGAFDVLSLNILSHALELRIHKYSAQYPVTVPHDLWVLLQVA